jgi:diaminopimelate epimerase
MSKAITFHKMVGTGNDFIVIDNRKPVISDVTEFAISLCKRHTGIGADGVILLEKSKDSDLKMRIINADGSEAEMCGNGMRCAAWAATRLLKMKSDLCFETLAGTNHTSVTGNIVRVKLPDPTDFRDYAPLEVKDGIFYFYYINTGVPHCVIFEENVENFPVVEIGREIRYHPHFQPAGTNVNFVHIVDENTIRVRTYERGVENETQACGTGSTASAIASVLLEKCKQPVTVITTSREKLIIDFESTMYTVTNVFLEGAVQYIFTGKIEL